MKKFLILISVFIFFMIADAQPEDCEIPGKAIHWIADYCMYLAETDYFLDEKVQTCFEKNQGYKVKNTCENKRKYKIKICAHLAEMDYFNGKAEICFKDREFVPATVKNDGI
jgi:hypothetical protein